MTEERRMFTSFKKNDFPSDYITFDKIAITTEHSISKVLLVEYLGYSLLFVSQHCGMGYNFLFTNKGVTIFRRSVCSFAFKGILRGKFYRVDFIPEEVELDRCLIAKKNMGWLCHRRLAHVCMRNLHKLLKEGHILGVTNIVF
jgi:hypothetical protein